MAAVLEQEPEPAQALGPELAPAQARALVVALALEGAVAAPAGVAVAQAGLALYVTAVCIGASGMG